MRESARVLLGAGVLLLACVDFGYNAPLIVPEIPKSSSSDGGDTGDCVEEEVLPAESGPQVKFTTLNVDVSQLRITAGDTVTWTNTDTMAHSVTAGAPGAELAAAKGGFQSPDIAPNAKWAFRFCSKRSVFYFCGKHPQQMNGYRVIVQ
jgi:plastocyanin